MSASPNSRTLSEYPIDNAFQTPGPHKSAPNSQKTTRIRVPSSSRSDPSSPTTRTQPYVNSPLSSPGSPPLSKDLYRTPISTQQIPQPRSSPSLPSSPSSTSPISLDMKRLLAKPAPPYARTFHGSGSESEGGGAYSSADGGRTTSRFRQGRDQSASHLDLHTMRELSFDRSVPLDLSLEVQNQSTPETAIGRSPSSRARAKSEAWRGKKVTEPEKEKEGKEKRVRNVLRRRPSTMTLSSPSGLTKNITSRTPSKSNTPEPSLMPTLHSPLPPISPHSPLSPSLLPTGSSSPSSSFMRPKIATPSSHSSSTDRPKNAIQPNGPLNASYTPEASTPVPLDHITSSATKGQESEGTRRLREPQQKGFPFPLSSPSLPALSQSRSNSPPHANVPQNTSSPLAPPSSVQRTLTTPSVLPSSTSKTPSKHKTRSQTNLRQRQTLRHGPSDIDSDPDGRGLTPAAAVAAAYKKQASLKEGPEASGSEPIAVATEKMAFTSRSVPEERLERAVKSLDGGSRAGGRSAAVAAAAAADQLVRGRTKSVEQGGGPGQVEARPSSSSGARRVATDPGASSKHKQENDGQSTPYYTVFGATAGRVVAVGGPDDHDHLSWDLSPLSSNFGLQSSMASLGRRSTVNTSSTSGGWRIPTRKRSGRLKRGAGDGEGDVARNDRRRSTSNNPGREKDDSGRSAGGRKHIDMTSLGTSRRSLRLSIDKFPEDAVNFERDVPWEGVGGVPFGSGSSPSNSPWRHRRLKSSPKDGSPASTNTNIASAAASPSSAPSGAGVKLWKLMKRISTGGLRDKYAHHEQVAPPVPALPKFYSVNPSGTGRPPDDTDPSSSIQPPSKLIRSPESVPKKTLKKKASLVLGIDLTSAPTSPKSPNPHLSRNARPSTTTRSSSPNSSDVASLRFFPAPGHKQSASAHSSTSSLLVDDAPTIPQRNKVIGVGRHIIPPSELGRIYSDDGHGGEDLEVPLQQSQSLPQSDSTLRHKSQSTARKLKLVLPESPLQPKQAKDDEWLVLRTPALDFKSLPLPPRRGNPTNRVRSDTNTPTPNTSWSGASVVDLYGGSDIEERVWERIWSGDNEKLDFTDDESTESPIIPSFSITDPINAFPSKRASTDTKTIHQSPASTESSPHYPLHYHPQQLKELQQVGPSEPPPRPSRSSQRPQPGSKSTPASPTISSPVQSHTPISIYDKVASNVKRISSGGQSTTSTATITNIRRHSGSFLTHSSLSSTPRRALTFRELGRSKTSAALTEQEKAARWDDLLEKSAEAGGTLHFNMGGRSGEHGLTSDNLRFSEISSVNSLTA